MEEIELVVKIPKYMFEDIQDRYEHPNKGDGINLLEYAVVNGTPLPKGHGKLITEPTEEDITKTVGGQNDFAECIKDAVKAVFDNADAIIEADKE